MEPFIPRRRLVHYLLATSACILLCLLPLIWEVSRYLIGELVVEYRFKQIKLGMDLSELKLKLGAGQENESCPETADGPVIRGCRFHWWRTGNGQEIWVGLVGTKIIDKWRSHYSL